MMETVFFRKDVEPLSASLKSRLLELLLAHQDAPVSGQLLSSQLGVTRAAVWKEIQQLRQEGFVISSATNRGYQLTQAPDLLTRELISAFLPERTAPLVALEEVDSTNTEAQRLILEGAEDGLVVVADHQTKGAGRMGRPFLSPAGVGIYLSMVVEPHCTLEALNLLTSYAGLAVCLAIEEHTDLRPAIKWPNDVILEEKKVCGILTKLVSDGENNRISHAIIGIGINVGQEEFPPELRDKAISLRQAGGEGFCRPRLAATLIQVLDRIFFEEKWLQTTPPEALEQLKERSCTLGREVLVITPREERRGKAVDLDCWGGLVVDFPQGRETVTFGEVSVRGVLGYLPQ